MTIWVLPSLIAVAILAGLLFYVRVNEPPEPLGPSTTALLLAVLVFAIGDTATYIAAGSDALWFATALTYSGIMLVAPSAWMLAHRFAEACGRPTPWGQSNWVYLPVLLITPVWLAMVTNPIHGQFVTLQPYQRNEHHWLFHVHTYISYFCVLATLLIYTTLSFRVRSKSQRRRILIMLVAPFFTVAGNLAYLTTADTLPFDPTPISLAITAILFFVGIYRVGLFSLSPVAMSEIIDHQPNGIVVTDMDGTLLHWNKAAEKSLQQSLSDVVDNFDHWLSEQLSEEFSEEISEELNRGHLAKSELTRKIEHLELDAPIPQFRLFHHPASWVQIRVDNILSRRNREVARSYFIRDISHTVSEEAERQNLERKMFQSQKLEGIGLLAGGIAHDFNNLLMAIRGNAELLSTDPKLDSNARKRLQVIETVSDRAARLTKKLLMYSGDAPTIKTPLDLSELVQGTSELIRTALLPKQLSLSLQLAPSCWIKGDASQLEQALLNLSINAAEAYEGSSGDVIIRTRIANPDQTLLGRCLHNNLNLDANVVLLEVLDAGCGMSPATLDRIVDPFFSSKGYGRGLGLSAVMGIVRGHNGAIYVQSDVGRGTKFCVLFPQQTVIEYAPTLLEQEIGFG